MSTRPGFFCIFFLFAVLFACRDGERNRPHGISSGKVVKVVDGDTYDLLTPNSRRIRIRIQGIDAPERGQPYYKISRDFLRQLCLQKDVRIRVVDKDRYGRTVAETFLGDSSVAQQMVRNGFAWHYRKYSNDRTLSRLELEARTARRGLWSQQNPVLPWEAKGRRVRQ